MSTKVAGLRGIIEKQKAEITELEKSKESALEHMVALNGLLDDKDARIAELEEVNDIFRAVGYNIIEQMAKGGWVDTLGHDALMNVYVSKLAQVIKVTKGKS